MLSIRHTQKGDRMKQQKKLHVTSLHHLLAYGATEFPQNVLFRFERKGIDYAINYSEFYEYVKAIAKGLIHTELNGKRIALIGETSVEWIAAYLATVISGGEVVPLEASLNPEQLINFVNLAQCELVYYSDAWAEYVEDHSAQMPGVRQLVRLTDEVFAPKCAEPCTVGSVARLSDFSKIGNAQHGIPIPDTNPEDMCALLFTSGTTGCSKGVMLSQKNICAVLNGAYKLLHQFSSEDVLLSVLPIHHTYELSCGILGPMLFGCCICINDSLRHITKNLQKYRPTVMMLVPLFLEQFDKKIKASIEKQGKIRSFGVGVRMSRTLLRARIDVRARLFAQIRQAFGGRLRYIISGGAALNPDLVDAFRDIGITVSQGYGITECAPLIAAVPLDAYNPKSCGRILDGMQVFIDKANASDTYGEIVVKGDNVMLGYYQNPEATAEVLTKGWFYTGDYGYVDRDNYLYITGRKKNVIVLPGGKNVFPEEIEEALAGLPLIEECVVLGRESGGDVIITAAVYPNRSYAESIGLLGDAEILARVKEDIRAVNRKLVSYKQIRKVELRAEPFEKTSTKKIKRFTVQ